MAITSSTAPAVETTTSNAAADTAMARFETQTSRYGSLTMTIGLLLSLAGPAYLVFFGDLDISASMVWIAFLAVAGTFGVLWFIEPLTYFPILGQAAMYQAFMIGNISNKLLPAALIAQSAIGAKPGTKRADLAAVMAIGGAATVHLTSLLILVGGLGTWLVTLIPADVIEVARVYILPSLLGAVLVQAIVSMRNARVTVIAMTLALVVQLLIVPAFPQLGMFATVIVVVASVIVSWIARDRKVHAVKEADPPATAEAPAV